MGSDASITAPGGDSTGFHFTVAPISMSANASASAAKAYFSMFDIMSLTKSQTASTVEAHTCALWFCLKSYDISVADGRQSTSVLASWSKIEFSPASSSHNDEYHFVDIPPGMNADPDTRYSVPAEPVQVLQAFMASKTWGNSSNINSRADYSSDWIQSMQNASSDFPGWISRLSLSMTNDVRVSGGLDPTDRRQGSQFQYMGTAYIQAAYVRVSWPWVVYPLVLMVLAFLYLAQTVWRTARDQVAAWKGDSLPMLFAHIDKGIHRIVGRGMDVPGGLSDQVGRTQVELVRRQSGQWLFKLPQRAVRRREAQASFHYEDM